MWTGSPVSVWPAMSKAGVVTVRGLGSQSGWSSPSAAHRPASGSAPFDPSMAFRRRRISAWLRRSPATSSDTSTSRTVSTTTSAVMRCLALSQAARFVGACVVVLLVGAVAVRPDLARVPAADHPAHDGSDLRDLHVALSVLEVVAAGPPL